MALLMEVSSISGHLWKNMRKIFYKRACQRFSTIATSSDVETATSTSQNMQEVSIPMPWGFIKGKRYGNSKARPIIGMHNIFDNAGTFDTIAPSIAQHMPFLSIDLPGHGYSSWLPPGLVYHSIDNVALILRLMEQEKWEKVSIIGHGTSGINGYVFAALFPWKVDLLISLNAIKPITYGASKIVDTFVQCLENSIELQRKHLDSGYGMEPPLWTWQELVEQMNKSSDRGIQADLCKHLLQRSARSSTKEKDKFFLCLDSRLKNSLSYCFSHDVCLEMAVRIKCPHLVIKSKENGPYERKEFQQDAIRLLQKNSKFEYHEIESNQYVHLNEADKVANIISPFLNKWVVRNN